MSFPTINIRISGVSVSGDIDAGTNSVRVHYSNSDQIGYATFTLQNVGGKYSRHKNSGSPTVEINFNNITKFRGTLERIEPSVSVQKGSTINCHCYDKGQELLNMISPDMRQPAPTIAGLAISGDQGVAAPDGYDLVSTISGVNALSGATVASFMSQYFGTESDPSGSFSGAMLSFKPYFSGYTYDTWYKPDGSPDNNINYWILQNTFKIRREHAWDVLRRITRGAAALDSTGRFVPFESYIGVSGDIHIFTSGSTEFLASGPNGQLSLIYYPAGSSGSTNNNVISLTVPNDSTTVKNRIMGWFPKWSKLPVDGDSFTDLVAYSGSRWSGIVTGADAVVLSGFYPSKSGLGFISIMAIGSGATAPADNRVSLVGTVRSGTLNIARYAGFGGPVALEYDLFISTDNLPLEQGSRRQLARFVNVFDNNGSGIFKSGIGQSLQIRQFSGFDHQKETLYNVNNTFNAGTGNDGGWAGSADLTQVKRIEIGFLSTVPGAGAMLQKNVAIDQLFFSFNYQFSPVVAFNSGSQGMYRRRYDFFEYPHSVSDIQASGLIFAELNSRMGSKQVGEAIVKDNAVQLNINTGQAIRIDAPTLNTGSGQKFDYWRVIAVEHDYSTIRGFVTTLRFIPWFSGTLVDPDTNLIDYTVPLRAIPPQASPLTPGQIWQFARPWANSRMSLIPTDGV